MNWQEKAAALDALSEITLKIRKPEDWYVCQRVEVKDGIIMRGEYGNGATPEEAIDDHWDRLTFDIAGTEKYLVAYSQDAKRRAVRWNGFMWADVVEALHIRESLAKGDAS